MQLQPYVDRLQQQLAIAAEAGGEEARDLAALLTASLDASVRIVLLDALSSASEEITSELAPGSVDVRLRGGEPEFVVVVPPTEEEFEGIAAPPETSQGVAGLEVDDSATTRLNLRLPESLKQRVEEAAGEEGLSLNAWLVRTIAAALTLQTHRSPRRPSGGDQYTGWVR